jgi:outer membrane protein OmpA-like peptidoglycan-associated protein
VNRRSTAAVYRIRIIDKEILTYMMKAYKQKLTAAVIAIALGLQSCSTVNPYTREEQTSKAGKGAMIGAAIGAVVGIATSDDRKDRKERALKGAGIGAITGSSVGYYMDVQEAKLRQKLERTGVSVTRDGDNLILNMPSSITFAVDKANLKTDFVDVLNSVADVLTEYDSTMIEVAGHTDSTGSDSHNQWLSQARAQAVADELIRFKVQAVRIDTVGYGESRPVASNDSVTGRQQNRRVEFTLLPLVEK